MSSLPGGQEATGVFADGLLLEARVDQASGCVALARRLRGAFEAGFAAAAFAVVRESLAVRVGAAGGRRCLGGNAGAVANLGAHLAWLAVGRRKAHAVFRRAVFGGPAVCARGAGASLRRSLGSGRCLTFGGLGYRRSLRGCRQLRGHVGRSRRRGGRLVATGDHPADPQHDQREQRPKRDVGRPHGQNLLVNARKVILSLV